MSFLIFQPSVAPHVQQAARSLEEAGQLGRFITSVREDPESLLQRAATAAGRALGRDWGAQFRRRAVTEVPPGKVESHPLGEWLRLGAVAADRSGRLGDLVWERAEAAFDRLVSRRVGGSYTGVYGFEYSSLATFRRARERGLRIVYEVPAPDPMFVQGLLEAEMESFPEMAPAHRSQTAAREERRTSRRRAEWALADLILVNSRFTRDSYVRAGLDCGKVRVVSLGAPPPVAAAPAAAAERRMTLIWAGTFGLRKGAHYLLEAWRAGGLSRHARLEVYGSVALPSRVLHPLPEGVELLGSVPRQELLGHYGRADALIFPTLCDGFGMVATEAWSRGLPVITTDRAGAADLLRPGENGLLVRPGDAGSIVECVEWCAAHRGELLRMREGALSTAARWQWSDYRAAHAAILRETGMFGGAP